MRNPNGYGCVYKATGKRRKPYIARITIGWTDNGKQIFKILGSFATVSEANRALADYNSNPYDIDAGRITFSQLYEKWAQTKYNKISPSMVSGYKNAFMSCRFLHDMQFALIKKHHMQLAIDTSNKTYSGKERMKMLISQLSQFAIENDVISKDYSSYIELGPRPDKTLTRLPFTEEQIKKLYQSLSTYRYTDTILMMIFTGVRPSELLLTETSNVHLDENYFICGIKTASSKNRKVPISRLVKPFFEKYYKASIKANSKWLILNTEGSRMLYSNYNRDKFHKIMTCLEMSHMPHDARHTFASLMDKVAANKLATQLIMGHSPKILIDSVYIHKTLDELQNEISKLESLFNLDELLSFIDEKYLNQEF